MLTRHFAFKPHGNDWICRIIAERGRYCGEDYVPISASIEREYPVPSGALEIEIHQHFNHLITWEEQDMTLSILPAKGE